jgi:hypothetical protein
LRLFLQPDTIDFDLKYVKKVCLKVYEQVEQKLNTVIVPKEVRMQPITFTKNVGLPLFDTEEEAIRLANDSPYGLAGITNPNPSIYCISELL